MRVTQLSLRVANPRHHQHLHRRPTDGARGVVLIAGTGGRFRRAGRDRGDDRAKLRECRPRPVVAPRPVLERLGVCSRLARTLLSTRSGVPPARRQRLNSDHPRQIRVVWLSPHEDPPAEPVGSSPIPSRKHLCRCERDAQVPGVDSKVFDPGSLSCSAVRR